jgi:hypothetical protein
MVSCYYVHCCTAAHYPYHYSCRLSIKNVQHFVLSKAMCCILSTHLCREFHPSIDKIIRHSEAGLRKSAWRYTEMLLLVFHAHKWRLLSDLKASFKTDQSQAWTSSCQCVTLWYQDGNLGRHLHMHVIKLLNHFQCNQNRSEKNAWLIIELMWWWLMPIN